jgi:alkylation response protein AidB-like acyl-CoA dehydrogenase
VSSVSSPLHTVDIVTDLSGLFREPIDFLVELSKVDPSVAVCADVHNTLVNSTLRLYGNDYVKDKYLPGLATNVVSSSPTVIKP